MNLTLLVAAGILLPFFGTTLGASAVFFTGSTAKPQLQKLFLGLTSGVMIAASIWSLLLPSIDIARQRGIIPWMPAAVGFLVGIGFLLVLDLIIPHLHPNAVEPEGPSSGLSKSTMLMLAVTLHNFPEGMAVGVAFVGTLSGDPLLPISVAMVLSLGIAIQNIPEGAIISTPLATQGYSKKRAFGYGVLSGVVEPIGALLTILLTGFFVPILPYVLSFAAGAMIYVVVEELIPDIAVGDHSNLGTIGTGVGFALMMILDVALG